MLDEEPVVDRKTHPVAILIVQDCDLDWDFKARAAQAPQHKRVSNLLFCEVQPLAQMREALRGEGIASDLWRRIIRNDDTRFHTFPVVPPEHDADGTGLPEIGVDFKRFFTIPTDEVYARLEVEARRRCFLHSLVAVDLSQRFAQFHARVALPDQYGP